MSVLAISEGRTSGNHRSASWSHLKIQTRAAVYVYMEPCTWSRVRIRVCGAILRYRPGLPFMCTCMWSRVRVRVCGAILRYGPGLPCTRTLGLGYISLQAFEF